MSSSTSSHSHTFDNNKNNTSATTNMSQGETGNGLNQDFGLIDQFNAGGPVASGPTQNESGLNNSSNDLHLKNENNFNLRSSAGTTSLSFSPTTFHQQQQQQFQQQQLRQALGSTSLATNLSSLPSTAFTNAQNQSILMRPYASMPSMKNNLQQPGAMNGQNPLATLVPGWTGSVNPADFAFSMSEKEMAELNRFRQGNSSAGTNGPNVKPQSPVSATNNSDRNPAASFNTNSINHVAQQNYNNGGFSAPSHTSNESNSLGLQNASTLGVPNVVNNAAGMNNNLAYQQMQYMMMNGNAQQNTMTQQQQLVIQQNLQRQAIQKNQQMIQQTNMISQLAPAHQRLMLNNFSPPTALLPQQQQYQQQQQQLQQNMSGGNTMPRNPTAQGNMMRPGMNSFGMANPTMYQQQQMALLNQQQKLQQQPFLMQGNNMSFSGQSTQRIQTMSTFEGTSHAAFNERVHFEKHYATYMTQLGLPSPPIILGSMIDVFMLFHAVYQAKGFEEVNRANGWGVICQRIGLDGSSSTQSTIFQYYQKSMLPLENNLKKGVVPTEQGSGITSNTLSGSASNLNSMIPQTIANTTTTSVNTPTTSTPAIASPLIDTPKMDTRASEGTEVKQSNGSGSIGGFEPIASASSIGSGISNQINGSVEEQEVDDNRYHPKVRFMKGLGGIDQFREFFQLSGRYKPSKDLYAPRNYHLLDLCLRSDLPSHIQFALDMLVCVSSEFGINFSDCQEFFKVFLLFFKEQLEKSFNSAKKSTGPNDFKKYADLFELEMNSCWQLQPNCVSSLDPISQTAQYAAACGLILRNCSFTFENQKIMAESPLCLKLILMCLDLNPAGDELVSSHQHLASSYPKTLEHRKNALICISNMGSLIIIPDAESASQIVRVCDDFIDEDSGTYRYTALSAIAKLLVNELNQKVFDRARNRLDLVQTLLKLFPWTGYQLSPTSFQVWMLSEWEFAMTILTVLITPETGPFFMEELLAAVPDVDRIMFNLYKRPQLFGMRATPIELVHQFAQLRERALRILFLVIHFFRQENRGKHAIWERKLLEASTSALNEADAWSVPILHDFLSQEYSQFT